VVPVSLLWAEQGSFGLWGGMRGRVRSDTVRLGDGPSVGGNLATWPCYKPRRFLISMASKELYFRLLAVEGEAKSTQRGFG
jgi:hypothetical protein